MKLVILDRDGVINKDSVDFVKSTAEWVPLEGSIAAIARLSKAGFTVVVATNQSGLGRGYFSEAELQAMHEKMCRLVREAGGKIAAIYHCPHRPEDRCTCRKPAPGMLDAIACDFSLTSLAGYPMIGDSLRDLEAAQARDCNPILVRTGKGLATEVELKRHGDPLLAQVQVFDDLAAASTYLIEATHRRP